MQSLAACVSCAVAVCAVCVVACRVVWSVFFDFGAAEVGCEIESDYDLGLVWPLLSMICRLV